MRGVTREHLREPRLAALVVGLLMVLYPIHFYVGWPARLNLSVGDALIAVVGPLWLLGVVGVRRLPRFAYLVAAFLVTVGVSIVVALAAGGSYLQPADTALELGKLLGGLAWFVGTFVLLMEDAVRRTRILALVSVTVAVVFAVVSVVNGLTLGQWRPTGPFENPNIYGNYLVFNGFLAAYLVESLRSDAPFLAGATTVALPTLAAAALVTASRGTVLGAGLGTAALLALHPRLNLQTLLSPIFIAAVELVALASVLVLWYAGDVRERLLASLSSDPANADSRFRRWGHGLDGFLENPLTGVGWGQSQNYVRSQGFTAPYPRLHNTHLTVISETGILGAVAFYVLFASVIVETARLARTVDSAYAFFGGIVVAMLGQGLVTGVLTFRSLWIATGSIAALSYHHDGTGLHFEEVSERLADRWRRVSGSILEYRT